VYCDNKAALSLSKDERRRSESSLLTSCIILHVTMLQVLYCRSEDIVSDCLTKALPRPLLQVGLVGLGMLRI
jgi:hypothetical protein